MTKQKTVTVKLIYPAFLCGRPHVAKATVEARLTPKQVVIERQRQPKIIYVNGHTSGPTGIGKHKYWRHNGMLVSGGRSWRLADGELERLNAEADERKANP